MENKKININIENINIESLIIDGNNLDLLEALNIKIPNRKQGNKKNKKEKLDISEERYHNNIEDIAEDEIPYVAPRRIKAKRNFDKEDKNV